MQILKEISKTKLVIVITHDHRICDYADEIITIEDRKVQIQKNANITDRSSKREMALCPPKKINHYKLANKNFKKAFMKYLLVSCIFSVGILCMMFSLSSGNIIDKSIADFKEKNIAFNNGYIKNEGNKNVYEKLVNDKRIENVYKQYKIENILLSMDSHSETMTEKYPMPKTKESMAYGTMPRNDKKEIALTPSLAKKFTPKINELIGKKLHLEYNNQKYTLVVSGIYNAGYDDFFVSSNVEKTFYQHLSNDNYYSINYDVKHFEDIVTISDELAKENILSENASEQVKTMQNTFSNIQMLFFIISGMILCVAVFITIIILIKMQGVRYKFVGLLYSFGFHKDMVSKIIIAENIMLTVCVCIITSILLIAIQFTAQINPISIHLSINEFIITILISCCLIMIINGVINKRLINISPVIALKN